MSKSINRFVSISSDPWECSELNYLPDKQSYTGNLSRFRSCRARAITFQLKRNASIPDTRTFKVQFVTTEGKVICERYINLDTNMINDDPELAAFSFEIEKRDPSN